MYYDGTPPPRALTQAAKATWIALILALALSLMLGACAGRSALPPPPPPAVKVLVPVAQACQPAQVDPSPLHTDDGVPGDIFEAVKQLLADHQLLKADREKLKAANTDPCPKG